MSTTSAPPSSARSCDNDNSIPTYWGWSVGNTDRTGSLCPYTGAPVASAIWTGAVLAAGVAAPGPAMRMGAREPASASATRSSTAGAGEPPSAISVQGAGPPASSSRQSIGKDRNTGPAGGAAAILNALASASGMSAPVRTSYAHFVNGEAGRTRALPTVTQCTIIRRSTWPAVTTSGVLAL